MSQVRLAVVGAGNQCTGALMPNVPLIADIDLVAICDLQLPLAQRNARNFGAKEVYNDLEKMLREQAPDAVMVVGPAQIHETIGLQVLEAGSHLFIEKPAAPTVAGAKRLVDAAQRAGKIGQVGHMMRHADPVRIAWDISHAPEFGSILSVESKYTTWPTGKIEAGQGWGEPDEDWTYMLVQGGHPIDLLRHFLGDIARVSAFRTHGKGNAKSYQVAVSSPDGTAGFLNLQDSFNGWYTGLEIVGDGQGIVRVDDLGRVSYRKGERATETEKSAWGNSDYSWEPHHTMTAGQRTGYGNQLRHFVKCIQDGTQPVPSLWDGWRNLVVAQAILDSVAAGKTVDVPA